MEEIQKIKEKLQDIIEKNKYLQNTQNNRNNIYIQIRELLDKNGLEDLSCIVEPMTWVINKYSYYVSINYEELIDQLYIGALPIASLKDKLAWMYLTEK